MSAAPRLLAPGDSIRGGFRGVSMMRLTHKSRPFAALVCGVPVLLALFVGENDVVPFVYFQF